MERGRLRVVLQAWHTTLAMSQGVLVDVGPVEPSILDRPDYRHGSEMTEQMMLLDQLGAFTGGTGTMYDSAMRVLRRHGRDG